MNRKHAVVVVALLLLPLFALAQDEETTGRTWGGYTVQQSIEFGGRIADIEGNQGMYDTLSNLHSGPRLFSQDLSMRAPNGNGGLFDSLYLTSFGFGGDPNDMARLRIHKSRWYDFVGLYRRDKNFFDYNLWGNPLTLNQPSTTFLNSAGQISPWFFISPHYQDTTRNMGDFNLTLFPQSAISVRLGYARNNTKGLFNSTLHEASEIDIAQNSTWRSDRYQIGLDFKVLPRTTISLDQFWEHDKVDQNWSDNPFSGFTVGGFPVDIGVPSPPCTPAGGAVVSPGIVRSTCNTGTYFYTRDANFRTNIPTSQLSLQSNFFKKLDITANGMYSRASSDLKNLNDVFDGLVSRTNTRAYVITGPASAKRITSSADLGLTYHLNKSWSVSDKFRWIQWRSPASFTSTEIDCFANVGTSNLLSPIGLPCGIPGFTSFIGTTPSGTAVRNANSGPFIAITPYAQFLGERSFFNTITLNWQPGRRFGGYIGYRYGRRELREFDGTLVGTEFLTNLTTPTSVPAAFEGEEGTPARINEHTALVGMVLRPSDPWRINADVELLSADNSFTQITPRHQQRVRVTTVYKVRRWASVNASAHFIESRNNFAQNIGGTGNLFPAGDIPAYGHKDHYRYYTLGFNVAPSSKWGFDAGWTYQDQKIESASCVPVSGVTPVTATGVAAPFSNCPRVDFTEGPIEQPSITGGLPVVLNYKERTNSFYTLLFFKPVKRVTLNLGYEITSNSGTNIWARGDNGQPLLFAVDRFFNIVAPGSPLTVAIVPGPYPLFPSATQAINWHKPSAGIEFLAAKGLSFKGGWAYFGYNEKADFEGPVAPRDFHANTGTLSLKYSF